MLPNGQKRLVRTGWRFVKELALPTVAAIIYLSFPSIQQSDLLKMIGIAAVAFTGVWFLQEQAQRVMKQERDKESFTETTKRFSEVIGNLDQLYTTVSARIDQLYTNVSAQFGALDETIAEQFGTLADTLKELQRQRGIRPETRPSRRRADVSIDAPFLDQAVAALRAGFTLPGLLIAAVGFEDAIRRAGERFGIKDYRGGATRILYQLEEMRIIQKEAFAKLRTLINLRNHLVHAQPNDLLLNSEGAQQVLDDFQWAIEYLTSLGD